MEKEVYLYDIAITTVDNPFDPLEDPDQWYLFDAVFKRYNTCEHLARVLYLSDQLTEEENKAELERAIDDMIKYDYENKYRKIKRPIKVSA